MISAEEFPQIKVSLCGYEIYPFLVSISTGRTVKQAICVWESLIQQGNQIVFQHSLHLGILPVLTIAVLQQQPGVFLRDISRQGKPAVKAIARQLYSIFPVGLDVSQIVVPVTMQQLCIDNGNIESSVVELPCHWRMISSCGLHDHTSLTVQAFELPCQLAQFTVV